MAALLRLVEKALAVGRNPWRKFHSPAPSHLSNIVVSVAGTAIPLAAGLVAIPMLLAGLGQERLGLFTLGLGLFGFAGILDLGIGRAITRTVAHEIGNGRVMTEVSVFAWRGIGAIAALGLLWGLLMFFGAQKLASALSIHNVGLQAEAAACIRLLALLIPVALLSGGLNGALEGLRAFRTTNAIRAPMGVATYLAPAIGSLITHSLVFSILLLVLVRVAGLIVLFASFRAAYPPLGRAKPGLGPLWRYSGWLTVSNFIAPLLTNADRYYLAGVFPPAAIATYTVGFDTIYRLTAFPFAAISAIFPSLSDPKKTSRDLRHILNLALLGGVLLWLIPLLIASMFAGQLLSLWMGHDFASSSTVLVRWILAGVAVNGFTLIPFMMLQADGLVTTTIKFHLMEVLPYVVMLVGFTSMFGLQGAAAAWGARVLLDAFLQFGAARRRHPDVRDRLDRLLWLSLLAPGLMLIALQLPVWLRMAAAFFLLLTGLALVPRLLREARNA